MALKPAIHRVGIQDEGTFGFDCQDRVSNGHDVSQINPSTCEDPLRA